MKFIHKFLLTAAVISCAVPSFAQEIVVTSEKPGGIYKAGEKIIWHVSVKGDGAADISKVGYVLRKGQITELGKGDLNLTNGSATIETKLDEPGSLFAEFTITPADKDKKPIKNQAGAVIEPEKIVPSAPPPADFDAFWKSKIDELAKVPMKPVLTPGESGKDGVDYWKITLDNIRGSKVQGQLARPKEGKKLPALLIVQWAGVYALNKDWATNPATQGYLVLNINAHDLPIDGAPEIYKTPELQNYAAIGDEDKDTSYFLRMYLSCYRAADYLASRDDWDGKTLVVMGTSQGGLQSLMIAGLHPKITAMMANVPAGCDQTGLQMGRQPGWPMWPYMTQGKDAAKVMATAPYYDVVNFARHIKCPALVSCGLIDQTCPPHGVIAAFNQIKGSKELFVMEWSDHQGKNGTQNPYFALSYEWLKEIAAGKPAPVKK